ncbi:MAG TPA: glycosyltransferase family 2 protein [Streptosporangiaceae bacterium]|nr:glycosyltransferase family 2 protein [Streptosporangiaceae bacterium]
MTLSLTPPAAVGAGGLTAPRISVVIPARNEAARIGRALSRIFASVRSSCEVIVVVDSEEDPTWQEVQAWAAAEPRLRCLVGEYGPGPANAIRFGIDQARAGVAVVTMADNSDDPRQIEQLAALVERGAAVAAASRYSKGGSQIGGPIGKSLLSRLAGRSLQLLARAGTRDATNSFKAYSTSFIREVGIDSRQGFAIGIELTAKARRVRRDVAEIPTIWLDREEGESGFRVLAWMPAYLRWYLFCFGRRLTAGELAARCARRARPEADPVPPACDPTPLAPRQARTSEWAAWHVVAAKDELVRAAQSRGAAESRGAA